jgi:hypothetical protein
MAINSNNMDNGQGKEDGGHLTAARRGMAQRTWLLALVVPMEITFMDNGGNIFNFCEFIDYVNSHII